MRGHWRVATAIAWALASVGPAGADPHCSVARLLDLPVTMSGRRPLVDATLDGHPARFIADSGAFYSMLPASMAGADGLRLEPLPLNFNIRGVGGVSRVSLTRVKSFVLGGHPFSNVEFVVGGSEVGGAGLLGQNVLGIADVEYDLADGMIRLMRAYHCGDEDLAYWSAGKPHSMMAVADMESGDRHTVGTVVVNGTSLRAVFDTGAGTSVLTLSAARRAGVAVSGPDVRPGGVIGGLGRGYVRSFIAPVGSFKVGDEEVRDTHLRIGDLGPVPFDMLVGADFFLSHRVYVANEQHRIYFTYNGGPVFDLSASPSEAAGLPTASATIPSATPGDADSEARRAAALAARHDLAGALALYDKAVALAPDNGDYLLRRARLHLALGQLLLAASDLDDALRLKPGDAEARLTRATLRAAARDPTGARADVDLASAALPPQADERLRVAELYGRLSAFDLAIEQFDLWIAAHPDDRNKPAALAARCWARTLANRELDRARDDCDTANHMRPRTAAFLNVRGLLRLRRGDYGRAIEDYDQALALEPKLPWALYGRGLAKQARGDRAGGQADVAAALALRPALAAEAKRFGLGS